MIDPDGWPSDYFASRDRFVELARVCGADTRSRAIEAVGPGGEPLSVDVATLAPGRAEHLIVLTSGVHGAEGFLGASVQHRVLERLARSGLPDGTGVALIHAVNPWGFAHLSAGGREQRGREPELRRRVASGAGVPRRLRRARPADQRSGGTADEATSFGTG